MKRITGHCTLLMALVAACWDTSGLGSGPYASAVSPEDCAERGLEGAVGREGEDVGRQPLFCTDACTSDAADCPLYDYIAELDQDLFVGCLPVEGAALCTVFTTSECPPGMAGTTHDGSTICYFTTEDRREDP